MTIECKLSWVPCQNGYVPQNAVRADQRTFVIRAKHNGLWTPGKAVTGHNKAYIAFGGSEVAKNEYEVLTLSACREGHESYHWLPAAHGQVPNGAVIAGVDGDGENLYAAKSVVNGEVCCGKLKPSHQGVYLPWGGKENLLKGYEVLCFRL